MSLVHSTLLTSLLVSLPTLAAANDRTPAEQRIERARKALQNAPEDVRHHNALAFGLTRRARETADPEYYAQAADALVRSLELAPGNLEARKLGAWVKLGQHDWDGALQEASAVQADAPDDVLVYGFLVDANVELGRYKEALEACQWMLDLRPGNVPGLTRASYLRELHGEVDGAIDLMRQAFQATNTSEVEDLAWIQTHVAHLERSRGRLTHAEEALEVAVALFPDYHYALHQFGLLRLDQGRPAEAAEFLLRRYELAPHPENAFHAAEALLSAGDTERARELFNAFEDGARGEMSGRDNANGDLVRFYVRPEFAPYRAFGPEEGLRLAKHEVRGGGNLFQWATLGEALLACGEAEAALEQLERALAVGIQDAELALRAANAARAAGLPDQEQLHLHASLRYNASSPWAAEARNRLREAGSERNSKK